MDESIRHNLVNAVDRSGNNAFSLCCDNALLYDNYFVDTIIPLIMCGSDVDLLKFAQVLLKLEDRDNACKVLACLIKFNKNIQTPHKYNGKDLMTLEQYLISLGAAYQKYVDMFEALKPGLFNKSLDCELDCYEFVAELLRFQMGELIESHEKQIAELKKKHERDKKNA